MAVKSVVDCSGQCMRQSYDYEQQFTRWAHLPFPVYYAAAISDAVVFSNSSDESKWINSVELFQKCLHHLHIDKGALGSIWEHYGSVSWSSIVRWKMFSAFGVNWERRGRDLFRRTGLLEFPILSGLVVTKELNKKAAMKLWIFARKSKEGIFLNGVWGLSNVI